MNFENNKNKVISIVIPAYNEERNLQPLIEIILQHLEGYKLEILIINDGSNDATLKIIKELALTRSFIKFISFSRNFGHQNALKAGFDHATGDCIITLDADLQHPIQLLPKMIEKWEEGFKIVLMIRKDTEGISFIKRFTSKVYYKLISYLSDINISPGSADFRLLDSTVVNYLRENNESYLFFRAFIPWLGFPHFEIPYTAQVRASGKTKYSVKKMIKFAADGITSFSTRPLRMAIIVGFVFASLAFAYALYALYIYFFSGRVISGWTSVVISVLLIGGIQLMFLGVLGEYIGKIFIQTKRRPLYIINETNIGKH